MLNWTNSEGNINNVDYSNVDTLTIFNGEEVRIRFTVNSNSSFTNTGAAGTGARTGFKIELYDGNTLIDDSKVHVPSGGSLPYADIATSVSANVTNARGFQDSTSVDFSERSDGSGRYWPDWSTHTGTSASDGKSYQAFFKFTDGTTNEGVVIQSLRVKIIRVTEDTTASTTVVNPPHNLAISQIRFTKYYRLETPQKPQIDPINPQPAVPDQDVPAWAEVIHNNPTNWNADAEIDITRGCEDEFE